MGLFYFTRKEVIPLAKVTKLDVSIDLNQPVNEAVEVVLLLVNSHPGRQHELLQQIDMRIGEALAALNDARKKVADAKLEAELEDPVK